MADDDAFDTAVGVDEVGGVGVEEGDTVPEDVTAFTGLDVLPAYQHSSSLIPLLKISSYLESLE